MSFKQLNKTRQHLKHPQKQHKTVPFRFNPMKIFTFFVIVLVSTIMAVTGSHIPTTLDGPFDPVTRRFDPSLRRGSDDLPMTHPRLRKNVTSNFPEQIALAISSPTSMWVSWVTGILSPRLRISKDFVL